MSELSNFAERVWKEAKADYENRVGMELPSLVNQPAWKEFQRDLAGLRESLDTANQEHFSSCRAQATLRMMQNTLAAAEVFRQ